MFSIRITPDAQKQFLALPLAMHGRVQAVFLRLQGWPDVSGAKPMRFELKGSFRIRCGDWRVLFTVNDAARVITVFRIANRRDVYD